MFLNFLLASTSPIKNAKLLLQNEVTKKYILKELNVNKLPSSVVLQVFSVF